MSMLSYRIVLFSAITLITYVLILGCTTHADTKKFDFVKNAELSECSKLPKEKKERCQNIVKQRIANYRTFTKKHNKYMKELQKNYQKHVEKIASLEKMSKDVKKSLAIRKSRTKAIKTKGLIREEFKAQQMLTQRLYESTAGIADILRVYRAKTQFICKVRDTERIDCVSLDSLSATYDNEMIKLILSDIDRVHIVYDLDFDKAVMFECGPGKWANLAVSNSDLSDFSNFLSGAGSESMLSNCSKYNDLLTDDSAENLTSSGGFSGMTGIDPFGLMTVCGLDIGKSDFDSFIENAMKMSEALHEYCTSDMVAEGSDESLALTPIPAGQVQPAEGAEIESSEQTGSTTDSQGNTTTTTKTTWSDGTTSTTSTTTDKDGNVTSTTTTNTRGNNSSTTTTKTDPQTGSTSTITQSKTNGITRTTTSQDGQKTSDVVTSSDGKRGFWTPDSGWKWFSPEGCAGEPCETCIDFADFNPKMIEGCTSGDLSFACDNFSNKADCCANENAYPADPRIVIPDPQGDFACGSDADPDLTDGMCQAQCSVAYSEDCYSNCTSLAARGLEIQFTLLDAICIYARSDACFTKEGIIPIPGFGNGSPRPEPLPIPHYLEESTALLDPGRPLDLISTKLPPSVVDHIIVLPDEQ